VFYSSVSLVQDRFREKKPQKSNLKNLCHRTLAEVIWYRILTGKMGESAVFVVSDRSLFECKLLQHLHVCLLLRRSCPCSISCRETELAKRDHRFYSLLFSCFLYFNASHEGYRETKDWLAEYLRRTLLSF